MTELTLSEYAALLDGISRPTEAQIHDFVDYVAHAHSWYKHLPLFPPGTPFYFFLDPNAGCDVLLADDGTLAVAERVEQGVHYSSIPTAAYRARFGYLAYACDAGTRVFAADERGAPVFTDRYPLVVGADNELYELPAEITDAGRVELTAIIHSHSLVCPRWGMVAERHPDSANWPEASGGPETLKKIVSRCRALRDSPESLEPIESLLEADGQGLVAERRRRGCDRQLYGFVAPERQRQYQTMVHAVSRVLSTVTTSTGNARFR